MFNLDEKAGGSFLVGIPDADTTDNETRPLRRARFFQIDASPQGRIFLPGAAILQSSPVRRSPGAVGLVEVIADA
jgi:hypothetical protein